MKTNKIIAAGLASTAILALTLSSASAMYGEGSGQGGGQGSGFGKTLTTEQRAELQSMTEAERQEYVQNLKSEQGITSGSDAKQSGHDKNPSDMLEGVELQDLSDAEKEMLYYGYSEELLAHDMYMYFYDLYNVDTFKNIADSELEHMTAVKALLDRYELDIPTDYGELTDEFEALKAEGEESLLKALEVGVKIELLDIDDIAETIRTTDNDDFKIMFTNIGGASYNHLRGFVSAINNNGLETEIDYSDYLSEEEVATKGGSLKSKMAEKLEAEGVELPEQSTSESIKANCDNEGSSENKGQGQGQGKGKSEEMNKGKQGQYQSFVNSNVNSTLKAKYKNTYTEKYGATISKMDDESLTTFVAKVDDILEKVNSGDFSDETKVKYNSMLIALREIAVENLDETESLDLDIESLFN